MPTAICRHVYVNGSRCGSPSLRDKPFCYHHLRLSQHHSSAAELPDPTPTIIHPIPKDHLDRMQREPILAQYYSGCAAANRRASLLSLDFPPLEDRESIQLALSLLITAMAQNRIEPRSATAILYGLQVASSNAANLPQRPSRTSIVTDTVLDDTGHELAPDVDPEDETDYQKLMHIVSNSRFDEPREPMDDDDYDDDDEEDEENEEDLTEDLILS